MDRFEANQRADEDQIPELNWLRYYYRHVQDGLGPASSDVNYDIMDAYIRKTGEPIPDGYDHREEDDE